MFEQSILDDRAMFASGGNSGGVTLLLNQGMLRLLFQIISPNKKWEVAVDVSNQGAKWIQVAGTWTLEGVVNLYLNGALNSTGAGEAVSTSESLPLGMYVGKLNSAGRHTKFFLDEWYFWDLELSADQVAQVYATYQTGTGTIQSILAF